MAKILITGGAGFIGSNLANFLSRDSKNDVLVVDNLSTGKLDNLLIQQNLNFKKVDVNDKDEISAIFISNKFDFVYHYAAVVGVQRTLQEPIKVLHDIEGVRNILELSRISGVKRVLYSSSSEVYGEPVHMPQHEETTPLNSRLPYAIVKNVGESYLRSYCQEYGLDYTIFRFFNTYGPRQSTDFVISKFLTAAQNNQDITVYGDGLQTRTFCYINDNLLATSKAMDSPNARNKTINIGSDKEVTIKDLAKKIIRITNSSSKIIHLPPLKEGDMTRRKPDISMMKELVKAKPTSLNDGIVALIEYQNSMAGDVPKRRFKAHLHLT